MELTLAENIRAYRKQRRLTQEQFAEVMGVTAGAVYKWETGASTPELPLIVEMADFFDVSVDALLGYKMKDNRLDATVKRLGGYCRIRDPRALAEAEKALKKYPNSFEVVHNCAKVYLFFGVGDRGEAELRRALELLEQARVLLAQNTDPKVGELTIVGEIAVACHLLGEREKSVELMKRHNEEGIFSDAIGTALAVFLKRPEEAEPYLSEALMSSVFTLEDTIAGYVFLFCSRGDYASARAVLDWGRQILEGLRVEPVGDSTDFTDKLFAAALAMEAFLDLKTGREDLARANLERAAALARRFDSAPDYGIGTFRFAAIPEYASFSDSLGASAAESLENTVRLLEDPALTALWREACRE